MGSVTSDGHMGWSHGMGTWDESHGMVTWDGSYGMVKVSSSFKTGGYTKCVIYTSHGNANFSGLTYASNLIPICVGHQSGLSPLVYIEKVLRSF